MMMMAFLKIAGEDFSSDPMLEHTLLVPPEFLMLVWRGPENLPLEQTLLAPGPPLENHGLGETKPSFLGNQDHEGFWPGMMSSVAGSS